jgi:hypothetical protein
MALSAVAWAGQPPQGSAPQQPGTANGAAQGASTPGGDTPDDEFIEFLGTDDVGDNDLWEFLKNSARHPGRSADPPSQDAEQ